MGDGITIGLLHPGEMGAAVGECLVGAGHRVLWVPAGAARPPRRGPVRLGWLARTEGWPRWCGVRA